MYLTRQITELGSEGASQAPDYTTMEAHARSGHAFSALYAYYLALLGYAEDLGRGDAVPDLVVQVRMTRVARNSSVMIQRTTAP